MAALLEFFETMPAWQKFVWIVLCISANWIVELGFPLMQLNYQKWKHAGINFVFLACDMLINVLFGLATVGLFGWMAANNFGLLYRVDLPVWIELLIAVIVLDLIAQYFVHFLLHKVKWMWKLHMVHHSDTHVDATTATRHHPGDYALREVFALVAIVLTGIPLAFYLIYRFATIFFGYFTHANIKLPASVDRALGYFIVTPNMHKFHHHFERPWTDTNFGNIFSIWDRMFGTLVYDDTSKIKYGLDVTDGSKDQDLKYQFGLPFDPTIKTDY